MAQEIQGDEVGNLSGRLWDKKFDIFFGKTDQEGPVAPLNDDLRFDIAGRWLELTAIDEGDELRAENSKEKAKILGIKRRIHEFLERYIEVKEAEENGQTVAALRQEKKTKANRLRDAQGRSRDTDDRLSVREKQTAKAKVKTLCAILKGNETLCQFIQTCTAEKKKVLTIDQLRELCIRIWRDVVGEQANSTYQVIRSQLVPAVRENLGAVGITITS